MITWIIIGLLVEVIRMAERYLRNLWTFEDFKQDPVFWVVTTGNFIATAFIWPITIILEIIEYFLRRKTEV